MAFKSKIIHNTKTGQSILFLQTTKDTNGELLEMETTYKSHSIEPPAHYHPYQTEDFKVISGELSVRIDGEHKIFLPGDTLHVPAGKVHSMWNNSNEKTIVSWKIQPAMDTEYLLETGVGIANNTRTNNNGMAGILQVALMANKFSNVFRLAKPAFIVQKILFSILSPIALLAGYRATYKKYFN